MAWCGPIILSQRRQTQPRKYSLFLPPLDPGAKYCFLRLTMSIFGLLIQDENSKVGWETRTVRIIKYRTSRITSKARSGQIRLVEMIN